MSTLGIMQPYFFPYLGYFQLIDSVKDGIIFDTVRYKRKSWMNRNRILNANGGWQYINVPVKTSEGTLIKDALVIDPPAAQRQICGQLLHYKSKAPFYREVMHLVDSVFSSVHDPAIGELNTRSLSVVCDYLDLNFNWATCSRMQLDLPPIQHAGQWALEISSRLGASRYVNLPGGRDIFVANEWEERGIELRFLAPSSFVYSTAPYNFEENLSILDVLMWNPPQAVKGYIRSNTQVVP
ncbi:WbqC family protein [Pseudomonas sp. R1-18]|uniref:WbqC family protein n=1 Tax=Pseudomonas sp. R1-18 TaxID=1632772 RepID=UPI003DA96077